MIIWRGRGILVFIFLILDLYSCFSVLGEKYNGVGVDIYLVVGLIILGLLSWSLGAIWNKERIEFNEQEQQYYCYKNNHTFFFIPMQYAGLIF